MFIFSIRKYCYEKSLIMHCILRARMWYCSQTTKPKQIPARNYKSLYLWEHIKLFLIESLTAWQFFVCVDWWEKKMNNPWRDRSIAESLILFNYMEVVLMREKLHFAIRCIMQQLISTLHCGVTWKYRIQYVFLFDSVSCCYSGLTGQNCCY